MHRDDNLEQILGALSEESDVSYKDSLDSPSLIG